MGSVDYSYEYLDWWHEALGYGEDFEHDGSLNSGHYYSYVKNINDNWYTYNDTMVSQMESSNVVSQSAYCLFYRLK